MEGSEVFPICTGPEAQKSRFSPPSLPHSLPVLGPLSASEVTVLLIPVQRRLQRFRVSKWPEAIPNPDMLQVHGCL